MDDRDVALREAARSWVRASDRLAVAGEESTEDADVYAVVLELAEEAGLARLRMHRALMDLGWAPPAGVRESPRS